MIVREIVPADYLGCIGEQDTERPTSPILKDFLYNAIFIPPEEEMPPREIIFESEIYVYINDFSVESDCGIVA